MAIPSDSRRRSQPAELRARRPREPSYETAPRRLTSSPTMKSHAAFNVAMRLMENNFLGCPHHKHDALATVVGLPHAEQTFARRIEVFFRWETSQSERGTGRNVAEKSGRAFRRRGRAQHHFEPPKTGAVASFVRSRSACSRPHQRDAAPTGPIRRVVETRIW
jgi:hypothetical protein